MEKPGFFNDISPGKPDRGEILLILLAFLVILSLANNLDTGAPEGDWRNTELEDVRTGENFSISELDKPLLLESFAVWCPTCTRQQQEIGRIHRSTNVTSVSIDVDPNEEASQVRNHIEKNGFDWRYAIAPPEMTSLLARDFGNTVLNPPSAPVILVCEEDSRQLDRGVKNKQELESEIREGC